MASDANMDAQDRRDADPGIFDAFASGLKESVAQPFNGASELFGGPRSYRASQDLDGVSKAAHDAGAMLGSAAVFLSLTAVTRRLCPGAGKFAPISAGAGLGFLAPSQQNSFGERLQHAAIGAGTASFLELGPSALTRMGVRGALLQNTISGGVAGVFHTQAESISRSGQPASLSETVLGAGTWAGTGLAFSAGGKFFSARGESTGQPGKTNETGGGKPLPCNSPELLPSSGLIDLPALEVGAPARHDGTITVTAGSSLATMYEASRGSIGRAEVLAVSTTGVTEGRLGTVFSVSREGQFVTANHVVDRALDITIFDRAHNPHRARVVASNRPLDIAVLQLKDPASFGAFEPVTIGGGTAPNANGTQIAFGHPNGWRDLYASAGTPRTSVRPDATARFAMHGSEGLSGAPILADGAVQSILIQGGRANASEVMATPVQHAVKLLEGLPSEATVTGASATKPKLDLVLIRTFKIGDQPKAAANLDKLFGPNFTTELPPSFFHSRVKIVPLKGSGEAADALMMKMQYNPAEQQVIVQPIAVNGNPIGEVNWPNSRVPIDSAKIVVKLDAAGKPTLMESHNDPGGILQQGFNYRGENNYLADLKPSQPRDWMDLLPAALRFRRLAKN